MSDDESLELKLARQARDEAEQHRKAAAADLEQARYERGQAEHAKRLIEQTERGIAERERWLAQHNEADLVAREQAVAAKFAEAQDLLARYDNDRHAAAIALQKINERELAARQKVA
jgi:hypothetical protein